MTNKPKGNSPRFSARPAGTLKTAARAVLPLKRATTSVEEPVVPQITKA
jgi:hypothetical protein